MASNAPSSPVVPVVRAAPDAVLTVHEVARMLRVNPKTVYAMAKRGELRTFRVGRVLRCRKDEVERFIAASEVKNVDEPARQER